MFFVCCCFCAVFFSDLGLGDFKELGLDAPLYVFSDVENLRRLSILEVCLVCALRMQVVEPLVDLIPLQASFADNFGGCLLFDIHAFTIVDPSHNFHLLLSLKESHSPSPSLLGRLHHLRNSLRRWGRLSDFLLRNFRALSFSAFDLSVISRGFDLENGGGTTICSNFFLLPFHLKTELCLSIFKFLLRFHVSIVLETTFQIGDSFERGSLSTLSAAICFSLLYFDRDHTQIAVIIINRLTVRFRLISNLVVILDRERVLLGGRHLILWNGLIGVVMETFHTTDCLASFIKENGIAAQRHRLLLFLLHGAFNWLSIQVCILGRRFACAIIIWTRGRILLLNFGLVLVVSIILLDIKLRHLRRRVHLVAMHWVNRAWASENRHLALSSE